MEPLLLLVLATSLAAVVAGASGPAYRILAQDGAPAFLGWANAVAAGLMLGAAYAVALQGWADGPGIPFGVGALFGIVPGIFVYAHQDGRSWDGVPDTDDASDGPTSLYASLFRHGV